jgi:beta-mannosidase
MNRYLFLIAICIHFFGVTQSVLTWEVYHPIQKKWMNYGQYGSVQEMLINSKELPNPFVGLNETAFAWIENHPWIFRSKLKLDEFKNQEHVELEFPSIDTYCKIYINDSLSLITSNAFLPYSIDVSDLIQKSEIEVVAVFTPPVIFHSEALRQNDIRYPAPNDVGSIKVAPLTRKPQYQFGWDWSLRMNTIGFLKPVSIRSYDRNKIIWSKIETKAIQENKAILTLGVMFSKKTPTLIDLSSKLFGNLPLLEVKNGKVEFDVALNNPKLWWPRGQGEPNLYLDSWVIRDLEGRFIDSITVEFGVRTSELVQEKDSVGTSYYFKINNRPIFCKGANYIPQDIFPSKVTPEKIKSLVLDAAQSNFNCLRVWGGGYYADDYFYDLCDSLGIMVWQDLMFACAMYPSDDEFVRNVREELVFQIPRMASHPSVILFNGNNEVDIAWKNWGFQKTYAINEKNQQIISESYRKLFQTIIPKIVQTNTFIPYIHTSPLGHWTSQESFAFGSQHYWGVWHGKDPIEDFGKKSGRFNAEYGFQSFPEFNTLAAFSSPRDWDLNSLIMKNHQKSYVGNGMIKKHADNLFGKSENFEEFVYFSQLTQAKAVSIAICAHRLNTPICMGTLYWQFNDCWPAPTWSSIDYYGNWKALQYQVFKDYSDVTVLQKTDKIGSEKYYLTSDLPMNCLVDIRYEVFDLEGKLLYSNALSKEIKTFEKLELFNSCSESMWLNSNYLIKFQWSIDNQKFQTRSFTHIGTNYSKASNDAIGIQIVSTDVNEKKLILEISNKSFVQQLWISSVKQGVRYSDNFIDLLPGKKQIIVYYSGDEPKIADFKILWR